MKKLLAIAVVLFTALYCFSAEHEYGYYYDNKSKKVYQMKCDFTPYGTIFYERQAIKKGGVWIPDPNLQDVGYNSGNCDFVYKKLHEVVKQGKMRRVQ